MDAIGRFEGGANSVNPKSGAYGRYQIMPKVWDAWSRHYFGRILPKTPANSELLASKRIDDYYRNYTGKIARGELSTDISIWTRIAGAWNIGPSLGKRSNWRDWGRKAYLYSTNVILQMNANLGRTW
jgi:muramidase (phage lysozyme)